MAVPAITDPLRRWLIARADAARNYARYEAAMSALASSEIEIRSLRRAKEQLLIENRALRDEIAELRKREAAIVKW